MPKFGTRAKSWIIGKWDSQLCDISLLSFPTSTDNQWGTLSWKEENTDNESSAYVRLDILDSSKAVLHSDIAGVGEGYNKEINLNNYNNVKSVDIYLRFKLYKLDKNPIVKDIELKSNRTW